MTTLDALKKYAMASVGDVNRGSMIARISKAKTHAEIIDYMATLIGQGNLDELTVTSTPGTSEGTTKISVTPNKLTSNSYVYKTNASTINKPQYLQEIDGSYVTWDGTSDIVAEDGHRIGIYEITGGKYVMGFGQATIATNLGRRGE